MPWPNAWKAGDEAAGPSRSIRIGRSDDPDGGPARLRNGKAEARAMGTYPDRTDGICLFTIGSRPFAANLGSVAEIVEWGGLHPVPLGPPSVLGFRTLRREVLPVIVPRDGAPPPNRGTA